MRLINNITSDMIEELMGDGKIGKFVNINGRNKNIWYELLNKHNRFEYDLWETWLVNLSNKELMNLYKDIHKFKQKYIYNANSTT